MRTKMMIDENDDDVTMIMIKDNDDPGAGKGEGRGQESDVQVFTGWKDSSTKEHTWWPTKVPLHLNNGWMSNATNKKE